MLSEAEKREIERGIEYLRHRKAAAVTALKVVQNHRRWVSDEAMEDIAEFLDLPRTELESIATFYNMVFRKPVGRHLIIVCDSISCWVMGYESVRTVLEKKLGITLGETSADGRFTLLPSACLGECDRAPVMLIDEKLYTNLTEARIEEILAEYMED
jgi:NADH-quinone oxidoreductase subunit E